MGSVLGDAISEDADSVPEESVQAERVGLEGKSTDFPFRLSFNFLQSRKTKHCCRDKND